MPDKYDEVARQIKQSGDGYLNIVTPTAAFLASAQSSAQGEEAREIVAARDEEWKAWIKAKGFNLEPLAGCL